MGEATSHYSLGVAYSKICRPGRAHAAFAACRRLREEVASGAGARDCAASAVAANALCREGNAAYLCGEFPAATQALIALVTNYAPVQVHGDVALTALVSVQDLVDANTTLGLAQVILTYLVANLFYLSNVGGYSWLWATLQGLLKHWVKR